MCTDLQPDPTVVILKSPGEIAASQEKENEITNSKLCFFVNLCKKNNKVHKDRTEPTCILTIEMTISSDISCSLQLI